MPITRSDFCNTIKKFPKLEDTRSQLWKNARKLLSDGYELEAYVLLLATWNFADFRYFLKNLNLDNFRQTIREIESTFEKIKNLTFEKADFSDKALQKDIKNIYRKLKKIVRQTGASKVMALKKPDLFVMWDTAIRKMYKIDNKASPEDYIAFLVKMKSEFKEIKWKSDGKPFAKAIDEYNYVKVEEKRRKKKVKDIQKTPKFLLLILFSLLQVFAF